MKRFAFLSLIILAVSCEFVPDEVPETIIQPPLVPPPIEFSLNGYEDTIRIDRLTNFSYTLNSYGRKILAIKITLSEKFLINYVKGTNTRDVTFTINPAQYNDGLYTMYIEIVTGTGSGSIADAIEGEGFVYMLNWPVIIDKTLQTKNSCFTDHTPGLNGP